MYLSGYQLQLIIDDFWRLICSVDYHIISTECDLHCWICDA